MLRKYKGYEIEVIRRNIPDNFSIESGLNPFPNGWICGYINFNDKPAPDGFDFGGIEPAYDSAELPDNSEMTKGHIIGFDTGHDFEPFESMTEDDVWQILENSVDELKFEKRNK